MRCEIGASGGSQESLHRSPRPPNPTCPIPVPSVAVSAVTGRTVMAERGAPGRTSPRYGEPHALEWRVQLHSLRRFWPCNRECGCFFSENRGLKGAMCADCTGRTVGQIRGLFVRRRRSLGRSPRKVPAVSHNERRGCVKRLAQRGRAWASPPGPERIVSYPRRDQVCI